MEQVPSQRLVSFEQAVELMRAGKPIIFPTETFLGLGSCALNADAAGLVFKAKHRSTVRPLPLIAGDFAQLDMVAKVPSNLTPLLESVWPGGVSIIFPARLRVPDILTGGSNRVAVRISSHPIARQLALSLKEPISASSANLSGELPVTKISELNPDLCNNVAGILDALPLPQGGLPSTLLEHIDGTNFKLLRPGAVPKETLLELGFSFS